MKLWLCVLFSHRWQENGLWDGVTEWGLFWQQCQRCYKRRDLSFRPITPRKTEAS